ncbi:MAG: alpha/beta fold hydrolase [Woeseiaceae bacterium]|nr:alpha/beta fold hydrolase [Woeseiaceae bacterium]
MRKINVKFENDAGDSLAGIIDMPTGEPQAFALFAHCFTCSKNLHAATNISRALTEAGFAVLRFDFTGLGQSEGEFADTSFSSNVTDLLAAVRFLDAEYEAPSLLIGHSLGGTAVLQAAHSVPSAVAVASIGSPAEPVHVAKLLEPARETLQAEGIAEVKLGGRPFTIKKQFLDDLESHPMPESLGSLRKAVMILHAPLDETVELENASMLFAAAKHPKSFVSLDQADHLLSREEDSSYVGSVIAAWASRYLQRRDSDEKSQAAEGEVVARTEFPGFRTDIQAGPHHLVGDEPSSVGGTNLGPTPYDLLAASLASCTTMTLGMYARHKKLDLRSASVTVTHDKIHAADCEDCETTSGKVDEFRRVLTLEGDLTEEQRERMVEIADRCPVHRTLHGEVKVRTRLNAAP